MQQVSLASLQSYEEVPLSPLPAKTEKAGDEEEGDEAPDGMPIDPLLANGGTLNGHCEATAPL